MTLPSPRARLRPLILLAATAALLCAPMAQAIDLSLKTLRVDRLSRSYFSERAAAGAPQPLIIALHGSGSTGSLLARNTGLTEIAEAAGYMVVYPNGTGLTIDARTWNSGGCCGYAQMHKVDDAAFIRALIEQLVKDGLADRKRIYVVGLSNGGMMAYRLATEAPELFKAVAVVSAVLDLPTGDVEAGVPLLHIHGSDDPFIPFLGGIGPREPSQVPRLSVAKSVDAFVRANDADPKPDTTDIPDSAGDGTSVRQYTYHSKDDPQAVVLYEIKGGGHNWPGGVANLANTGKVSRNLDASRTVVAFFNQHGGASPEASPDDGSLPPGAAPIKPEAAPAHAPMVPATPSSTLRPKR